MHHGQQFSGAYVVKTVAVASAVAAENETDEVQLDMQQKRKERNALFCIAIVNHFVSVCLENI